MGADCSHEIKRSLLLGRKAVINLDSLLKSRDITLLTKVRLVKWCESESCSVLSDSLRPNVWYCPRNSPGLNTGVGSLSLLQGIFPTQGSGLPHCRQILYKLSHKGSPSSQNYGFSSSHVWMWELEHKEGWALKNWYFQTVVFTVDSWFLRVPWTARRSNQSILKEISPGCSLEGLMLKLKLQYFGHLMGRADSLEKTLILGKIEGRRRGRQDEMTGWHHQLNGHESEQTLEDSGRTGKPGVLQSMGSQRIRHGWATEQQSVVTLQLKYKALFHWKKFEAIELLQSSGVVYLKVQIKKLDPNSCWNLKLPQAGSQWPRPGGNQGDRGVASPPSPRPSFSRSALRAL